MKFQLRPILSEIKDLYSKPISTARFKEYIAKLQGDTNADLALPISGFNPMAKDHILEKIDELEKIDAEKLIEDTIHELNSKQNTSTNEKCLVVLNIADDLKGGWTNYYATDFDSKFKLNAFVSRKFCVPYFWTGESYSEEIIKNRTIEYLRRTLYRLSNPQPKTLEEHLEQEIYAAAIKTNTPLPHEKTYFKKIEDYYTKNKKSEKYDRIFNFFYGDEGSESLGYKKYGIAKPSGYDLAKIIAKGRKKTT